MVYMRSRPDFHFKKAAFSNSRTTLNIVAVRFVLEKKIDILVGTANGLSRSYLITPWFSLELLPFVLLLRLGRNLLMEFVYDSADAAGQNGVTITTWHACQWALKQIAKEQPDVNIREFYIETKFSGDKNAVAKNYIKGRGLEVQAEAYVTESVLQNVLKVPSIIYFTLEGVVDN